jgi:hypothetical protein
MSVSRIHVHVLFFSAFHELSGGDPSPAIRDARDVCPSDRSCSSISATSACHCSILCWVGDAVASDRRALSNSASVSDPTAIGLTGEAACCRADRTTGGANDTRASRCCGPACGGDNTIGGVRIICGGDCSGCDGDRIGCGGERTPSGSVLESRPGAASRAALAPDVRRWNPTAGTGLRSGVTLRPER